MLKNCTTRERRWRTFPPSVNYALLADNIAAVDSGGTGGLPLFRRNAGEQSEEKQAIAQQSLLPFPETDITGLTVSTPQGVVEMKRRDQKGWTITAPLQTDADMREVQSMIRALVTGKVLRSVEEKPSSLAPFGLEQPITTITVTAGTQQETLSIGDNGPLSLTRCVHRHSSHSVLLTT